MLQGNSVGYLKPTDRAQNRASWYPPDHGYEDKQITKKAWCVALYIALVLLWLPPVPWPGLMFQTTETRHAPPPPLFQRLQPDQVLTVANYFEWIERKALLPEREYDEPSPNVGGWVAPEPGLIHTEAWPVNTDVQPPVVKKKVAHLGDVGLEPPVILTRSKPAYPKKALEMRLQGYVVLRAVLRKTGEIDDIVVLRGLGRGKFGFEKAAKECLAKWKFIPGTVDGKPIDVRMNLRIDFIIN